MEEQNDLQLAWNVEARHYEEKNGEIEVGGKSYQFKVSFLGLDKKNKTIGSTDFPTNRRVITEVAVDLQKRNDIVVPVLPGWGETSAQFEGDFLEILLDVLRKAGYENPKIIGINCSGRGTPDYLVEENRKRISGIGLMNEVYDADEITEKLITRGYFGDKRSKPDVAVIGHSLGFLNSVGVVNILNYDKDLRVKKLLAMMPAVDGPFAMLRAKFLWAVRKQIMPAVTQRMKGSGALELNEADYHRIMFGDKDFKDPDQYGRSVPDSAKRFLDLTLNTHRRFDHVFRPEGTGDGVDLTILKGGKDRLISNSVIDYLPKLVRDGGLKSKAEVVELPALSHSIPFRLRDEQRDQVRGALEKWIA